MIRKLIDIDESTLAALKVKAAGKGLCIKRYIEALLRQDAAQKEEN